MASYWGDEKLRTYKQITDKVTGMVQVLDESAMDGGVFYRLLSFVPNQSTEGCVNVWN